MGKAYLQCTMEGSTTPTRFCRTLTTKLRKSAGSSGTPWSGQEMYCMWDMCRSSCNCTAGRHQQHGTAGVFLFFKLWGYLQLYGRGASATWDSSRGGEFSKIYTCPRTTGCKKALVRTQALLARTQINTKARCVNIMI